MDTEASRPATSQRLSSPPDLTPLLVKALLTAGLRRGGELPTTEFVLEDQATDPDRLADYARVCGFRLGVSLPPTYPHILGFPLAMRLMTDPGFPFPLPGLVHTRNLTVQYRPIPVDASLTIRVRADSLTPTERGREFAIRTEAYHAGTLSWEEASWYVRLERHRRDSDEAGKPGSGSSPHTEPTGEPTAIWRIPPDAGKRYAAVSGDHNPIHRHPLGARLAGFRRPIAHGMWTMARCLAGLEGRFPDASRAKFRFRRPIPLGIKVGFGGYRTGTDGWQVAVTSLKNGKAYLTGTIEGL
jgi:hypothetical protein